MTVNEAVNKLDEQELKEFAYRHACGMLHYDGETGAPRDSALPRGKSLGILSGEMHKLATSSESLKLLDFLKEHKDELTPEQRRRVELRDKDLKELQRIPVEEFVAFRELLNESSAAWHEAKEKSDYAIFEPYLKKVIEANKRFAQLVEPDMKPYDYCLDKFEEGLNEERCDKFFGALREKIVPLVDKIKTLQQPDVSCTSVSFPISAQRELAYRLMDIIGVNRNRCGLSETEHPFTTGFSKYDIRITTNYKKENFLSSMYSVIHESGHAMYALHPNDGYAFNCLGDGVSMGVHESQSRFFENIIGRSREFIALVYPDLISLCPALSKFSVEDIYRAANKAEPSLIRTEADELTYSLHVMIRYEIEKAFINGEVPTKELPDMWNAMYKEYLGIDVPDARRGILQDSHWSNSNIGYFPSYALGSAYGAQLLNKMSETINVKDCIKSGDLGPVNSWLEEHIWKYGSMYTPTEVIEKAMGAPFDPKYYTDYLERKMAGVYGF
ncbi:MAG: carboxypeptidase M32 [Oscillospiraceae bacterium]